MRTRKELVNKVVHAAYQISGNRYYKSDVNVVIDALLYTIEKALAQGENVHIQGFGAFNVHHYKRRRILSPVDGSEGFIEPYDGVKFVPGDPLKRAVAEGIVRFESSEQE